MSSGRLQINLQPEVLRRKRERAGLAVEERARKLNIRPDCISPWETPDRTSFIRVDQHVHHTHIFPGSPNLPKQNNEPKKQRKALNEKFCNSQNVRADQCFAIAEAWTVEKRELLYPDTSLFADLKSPVSDKFVQNLSIPVLNGMFFCICAFNASIFNECFYW